MPKGADPMTFETGRVDYVPASSGLVLGLQPTDIEGSRLTVTDVSLGATLTSIDGLITLPLTETLTADGSTIWVTVPSLTAVDPTGKLDEYTLTWSATNAGTGSTYYWRTRVNYCGGYHFSTAGFRSVHAELLTYTDEQVQAARAIAEQQLEYVCRLAFVRRGERETIRVPDWHVPVFSGVIWGPSSWSSWGSSLTASVPGGREPSNTLRLKWAEPVQIYSLSVDGTAWTADQIAALYLHPGGMLIRTDGTYWPAGSIVKVHYQHGLESIPADLKRASIELTADILRTSDLPTRATSIATDVGTFRISLPGRDGTTTGIPEVDAAIARYTRRPPEVG